MLSICLSKSSIQKWVIRPNMYHGLDAAINRTQHLARPGDTNAYIASQNFIWTDNVNYLK